MTYLGWMDRSACAESGLDPNTWFPESPQKSPRKVKLALLVCATCPVTADCLQYATQLSRDSRIGIMGVWGGRYWGSTSQPKGSDRPVTEGSVRNRP